jgi:para-nitrobenzyl esterase
MMDVWLDFARSGDPGWPAYEPTRRTTMIFGRDCGTEDDPQAEERKVWEGRY